MAQAGRGPNLPSVLHHLNPTTCQTLNQAQPLWHPGKSLLWYWHSGKAGLRLRAAQQQLQSCNLTTLLGVTAVLFLAACMCNYSSALTHSVVMNF